MKRLLLFIAFLSFAILLNAQREFCNWYFGDHYGLEFRDDTVIILPDGGMHANDANNTVSNKYGDLLFYTNGMEVFNSQHDTMPNGMNLGGDNEAQTTLIIPHPSNNNYYFIISTLNFFSPSGGLFYSIVDMQLDNGLGDVTDSKIVLSNDVVETASVVRHCNNKDYWLIAHTRPWNGLPSQFYVWEITNNGINVTPLVIPSIEILGRMVFNNHNNAFFTLNLSPTNLISKFNFDNSTGSINYDYTFTIGSGSKFELSSNGQKLYSLNSWYLHQYDLSSNDPNLITSSGIVIDSINLFHHVELSSDNKIYISFAGSPILSQINKPNEEGLACDLSFAEIDFGWPPPNNTHMVLPQHIAGFKYANSFTWDNACFGDTTQFTYLEPECGNYAVLEWNFGDPYSSDTISISQNPKHYYSQPGTYTVSLTATDGMQPYTVYKTIEIYDNHLNLGPDQTAQQGDTITIDVGFEYFSYDWSTGDTVQLMSTTIGGMFSLTVTDRYSCVLSDTVLLSFLSIEENNPLSFTMFPVPSQDYVFLNFKNSLKREISLYSITGKLLQQFVSKQSNVKMLLTEFAAGIYFVKVNNGKQEIIRKLIVE